MVGASIVIVRCFALQVWGLVFRLFELGLFGLEFWVWLLVGGVGWFCGFSFGSLLYISFVFYCFGLLDADLLCCCGLRLHSVVCFGYCLWVIWLRWFVWFRFWRL